MKTKEEKIAWLQEAATKIANLPETKNTKGKWSGSILIGVPLPSSAAELGFESGVAALLSLNIDTQGMYDPVKPGMDMCTWFWLSTEGKLVGSVGVYMNHKGEAYVSPLSDEVVIDCMAQFNGLLEAWCIHNFCYRIPEAIKARERVVKEKRGDYWSIRGNYRIDDSWFFDKWLHQNGIAIAKLPEDQEEMGVNYTYPLPPCRTYGEGGVEAIAQKIREMREQETDEWYTSGAWLKEGKRKLKLRRRKEINDYLITLAKHPFFVIVSVVSGSYGFSGLSVAEDSFAILFFGIILCWLAVFFTIGGVGVLYLDGRGEFSRVDFPDDLIDMAYLYTKGLDAGLDLSTPNNITPEDRLNNGISRAFGRMEELRDFGLSESAIMSICGGCVPTSLAKSLNMGKSLSWKECRDRLSMWRKER